MVRVVRVGGLVSALRRAGQDTRFLYGTEHAAEATPEELHRERQRRYEARKRARRQLEIAMDAS